MNLNPQAAPALSALVDRAIAKVQELSQALCRELAELDPVNEFSWEKYEHMERLLGDAPRIAAEAHLNSADTQLFRLISRAHDIGRHREALLKLDTLRPGQRHGVISRQLIEEHAVLEGFAPEDQQVVLAAVEYHSEKEVPLPDGRARTLCYILRDLDKLELLESPRFLEPAGVLGQLRMHYLNDEEKTVLDDADVERHCWLRIEACMTGGTYTPLQRFNRPQLALIQRVAELMTSDLNSTALEQFLRREQIDAPLIADSYTSYMLWISALIFDISQDSTLRRVRGGEMFEKRMAYLTRYCSSVNMRRVTDCAEGYFAERLG